MLGVIFTLLTLEIAFLAEAGYPYRQHNGNYHENNYNTYGYGHNGGRKECYSVNDYHPRGYYQYGTGSGYEQPQPYGNYENSETEYGHHNGEASEHYNTEGYGGEKVYERHYYGPKKVVLEDNYDFPINYVGNHKSYGVEIEDIILPLPRHKKKNFFYESPVYNNHHHEEDRKDNNHEKGIHEFVEPEKHIEGQEGDFVSPEGHYDQQEEVKSHHGEKKDGYNNKKQVVEEHGEVIQLPSEHDRQEEKHLGTEPSWNDEVSRPSPSLLQTEEDSAINSPSEDSSAFNQIDEHNIIKSKGNVGINGNTQPMANPDLEDEEAQENRGRGDQPTIQNDIHENDNTQSTNDKDFSQVNSNANNDNPNNHNTVTNNPGNHKENDINSNNNQQTTNNVEEPPPPGPIGTVQCTEKKTLTQCSAFYSCEVSGNDQGKVGSCWKEGSDRIFDGATQSCLKPEALSKDCGREKLCSQQDAGEWKLVGGKCTKQAYFCGIEDEMNICGSLLAVDPKDPSSCVAEQTVPECAALLARTVAAE